jgi:hypothetical protein
MNACDLLGLTSCYLATAFMQDLVILNTSANSVLVRVSVSIFNPSNSGGLFGPISLAVDYEGTELGVAAINDLDIAVSTSTPSSIR